MVPEVILILGGRKYSAAVYCLPPLIVSCVFQFIYTMYVNIEFFMKKTFGVSMATIVATSVNIVLDLIILPRCGEIGYIVTAYTTMVGYVLLFILHYFMVKRLKMDHVYDIRFNVLVLLLTMAVAGVCNVLYGTTIIRYVIVLVYGAAVLYVAYKYRDKVIGIFKKKKRRIA